MAGLFDVFTNQNAVDAANAQISGINAGQTAATNAIAGGNQNLMDWFTRAAGAYSPLYSAGNAGVNQLQAALGIGGPGGAAGGDQITAMLRNTPGYQFRMDQGAQNVLRNAAQAGGPGGLASGGTLLALQQQGQGVADQTYQQYIQNLQPFLGAAGTGAGGISNAFTNLGAGLNQNANTLANLGWTANTSIGNATANAALANNQASANEWSAIGNAVKLGASVLSDARTKTDTEKVGELYDGTNVYRFKYDRAIDPSGKTHLGVMAQEVERTNPGAVREFAGIKFVDYGKATEPARQAKAMFDSFLKAA